MLFSGRLAAKIPSKWYIDWWIIEEKSSTARCSLFFFLIYITCVFSLVVQKFGRKIEKERKKKFHVLAVRLIDNPQGLVDQAESFVNRK